LLSITMVLVGTVSVAFSPGAVFGLGPIQNPLGLVGTVAAPRHGF
jgi:hypothetical protein